MQPQHIALVPEGPSVNASELTRVSAALQKQVTRDLGPLWGIAGTVDAFPHLEDVPIGYWPIVVTARPLGSRAGVHLDKNGQPYAEVELGPSWSLAASRECLEMLVDPFGNRLVPGASPRADQGRVEFLAEVCGPCGHAQYAYTINDVLVSDFCTPAFLEPIVASGERYSFTGAIEWPHQVLPGGHLGWFDPISDTWWLRSHFGDAAIDECLGGIDRQGGTLRDALHLHTPNRLHGTKLTIEAFEARMGIKRQRALYASQAKAYRLRASLEATLSRGALSSRTSATPLLEEKQGQKPSPAPAGNEIEDEIEAAIKVLRARRSLSSRPPAPPALPLPPSAPSLAAQATYENDAEHAHVHEAELRPVAPAAPAAPATPSRQAGPPPLPPISSTAPAVLDQRAPLSKMTPSLVAANGERRKVWPLAALAGVSVFALLVLVLGNGSLRSPATTASPVTSGSPALSNVWAQAAAPTAPAAVASAATAIAPATAPSAASAPAAPAAAVARVRPQALPAKTTASSGAPRAHEEGADAVDNLIHDRM